MYKYNHKKIESKWADKWVKDKTFTPDLEKAKDPYYALFMFPYPSAEGLHIGNFYAFTCVDVMAKYKKLQGKDVFEPIGFDAFGMHSENYALKIGETPKKMLNRTMANFRKQLSSAGLGCDWTREIDTTAPEYYKWTQWIFTKLFEKGLAYQKEALLNWCPSCKTVLADEQIENGVCERCKSVPEKKTMKQWFLKITAYAQRLLDGLDDMDWSDITKNAQRNWIGRSEGAMVKFQISDFKYNKILLATSNISKRKRVKRLLKSMGAHIKVLAPEDLKIERADIAEDGDLFENAKNKALAYRDKTDLPILGTDTGFYIKDETIDPVKVRRNALKGENEKDLSQEQIAKKMFNYYKEIARKNNGQVDAYWKDCFVLSLPDGSIKKFESKREVILTDQISGEIDIYIPIRCLYKPKVTGKYVSEQSEYEELKELEPITNSLVQLLCVEDAGELEVFTTRPDTLFGATYMVLSPEYPLVKTITFPEQKKEVEKYIKESGAKSDLERAEAKEKTGVFTGAYAVNPVNNEKIPVWIADYVLMGYGTGAIMAVPAHDERDFEFAKKYNLLIKEVVIPIFGKEHRQEKYRETITALVYRKKDNKFLYLNDNHYKIVAPIIGGIKKHESIKDTAEREVYEETGYKVKFIKKLGCQIESHFFASHKNVRRHRLDQPVLCELLDEDAEPDKISEQEKNKHKIIWLTAQEALKRIAHEDNKIGLLKYLGKYGVFCGDGRSVDSKFISGLKTQEAKKVMIKWLEKRDLGKGTVNYKLRDWCISRQRYWGPPVPVIYCEKCARLRQGYGGQGVWPVPEKDLPVRLPELEKGWEPAGDGRGPLAKVKSFMKTTCPKCNGPAEREPDVMDNFLDSAWYFFRYISPHDEGQPFDKLMARKWLSVDFYVGGNEHAVLHLMYTRFITMALHDLGLIDFDNPFKKFRANGMILKDGKKMSKSKGNIVHPEEYGEKIGYDALKIYLLFLGPLSEDRSFSDAGALGAKRWVERIARLKEKVNNNCEDSVNTIKKLHQTIKIVTSDFEGQKYNTAIARLMELTNTLSAEKNISNKTWEKFLILTAPFAPALAEELWSSFAKATEDKAKKYKQSIFNQKWPKYDPKLIKDDTINLVVQVNGKLRDTIEVAADISEKEAKKVALESEKIKRWIKGKKVVKVIFVKGKLVNIVIK